MTPRAARLWLPILLLIGAAGRLSGQVGIRDVTSGDPFETGNGCDSSSFNGQIDESLQSMQWAQRVTFRIVNSTSDDVTVTVKAYASQYWKSTTLDVGANGSPIASIDVIIGCVAYSQRQVNFGAQILSWQSHPKQLSQQQLDAINGEAKRLGQEVQAGRMSAASAIANLDSKARSLGIPSDSNWASFRSSQVDFYTRMESQRRSEQANQQQQQQQQQTQARQAQAANQDAAARAQAEQLRKQQEIKDMQDKAAAARAELKRQGEEMARRQQEETARMIQQMQDRQRASQDALQASQEAAAAAAAAPHLSEDDRYHGDRSQLASRLVEDWKPGKHIGGGTAQEVALVDPFVTPVPKAKSPVRVDPASPIEMQCRQGKSGSHEVFLYSDSPAFQPTVVRLEGLPAVQATIEKMDSAAGVSAFRLRIWTLATAKAGGSSGRVQIATSLSDPTEISVPVAVRIEK